MSKVVLVPTPIGNLGDVSKRAIEELKGCDVVYCEDTRVTVKLLSALSIKKPLCRMDENSISEHVKTLVNECKSGKVICYCSDAGMPGISDPGSRIVSACRESGVNVEVLPGANAALTALVSSGFDSAHFFFEGFLPKKKGAKEARLQQLLNLDCPAVIYESPNRITDTLSLISELAPLRKVCVARELTKLHEEVLVGTAEEVSQKLTLKGEFVLIIDAPSEEEIDSKGNDVLVKAKAFAEKQASRGIKPSDIREDLQAFFNISKNDAYELSITVTNSL